MESIRKRSCIRNAAKRCIEDKMAAVCNKRLAPRHPQCNRAGKAETFGRCRDRDFGGAQPNRLTSIGSGNLAERPPSSAVGNDDHVGGRGTIFRAARRRRP